MRSTLRVLKYLLIGVIIIASCSSIPTLGIAKTKIVYWALWGGYEEQVMRVAIDKFNKSQDEIEVEYQRVGDIGTKLLTAIAAGDPPDLAFLWSYSVPEYAQRGALMPLDSFVRKSSLKKDMFIPAIWNLMFYGGKMYSLPILPWNVAFYWNKGLFREAGLDPNTSPKTIEELDKFSEKLTVKDDKGRIVRMGFIPWSPGWWEWSWPYFFGGKIYDDRTHKVILTSTPVIKAYTWEANYSKKYGVTQLSVFTSGLGDYFSQNYPFFTEKTAMELAGCWEGKYIKNNNPKIEFGVALPPVQRPAKYGTNYVYADTNIIPKGSKHPNEAFKFMEYLYREDVMSEITKGFYTFSPIKVQNQNQNYLKTHENPNIEALFKMAVSPNAFFEPRTPAWSFFMTELGNARESIVQLKAEPEAALKEAEVRIQAEVDRILGRK
ncbi:MAG: ABC transporter substrate-binding protein [Dictyoglomi bacterium]|nr:ABC transporter substrate-binding protein [Dictyoglomota bacterium]